MSSHSVVSAAPVGAAKRILEKRPRVPKEKATAVAKREPVTDVVTEAAVPSKKKQFVMKTNFHMSELQVVLFNRNHPDHPIRQATETSPHSHPTLALERRFAESHIVDKLISTHKSIVDIGGNAIRHARSGRVLIHSLCPELTGKDTQRLYNIKRHNETEEPKVVNYCTHTWQECTHYGMQSKDCMADVAVLIHSLYYFTVDDVIDIVLHTNDKVAYAAVHIFDGCAGKFANGEATWRRIDDDRIIMRVQDLAEATYSHGACNWLHERNVYRNARGVLTWQVAYRTGDTVVYRFLLAGADVGSEAMYTSWDRSTCGAIDIGEVNRPLAFSQEVVPISYAYNVFGMLRITLASSVKVVIPVDLVNLVANYVCGKTRDYTLLTNSLRLARDWVSKNQELVATDQTLMMMYSVIIGFYKHMGVESNVMITSAALYNKAVASMNDAIAVTSGIPYKPGFVRIQLARVRLSYRSVFALFIGVVTALYLTYGFYCGSDYFPCGIRELQPSLGPLHLVVMFVLVYATGIFVRDNWPKAELASTRVVTWMAVLPLAFLEECAKHFGRAQGFVLRYGTLSIVWRTSYCGYDLVGFCSLVIIIYLELKSAFTKSALGGRDRVVGYLLSALPLHIITFLIDDLVAAWAIHSLYNVCVLLSQGRHVTPAMLSTHKDVCVRERKIADLHHTALVYKPASYVEPCTPSDCMTRVGPSIPGIVPQVARSCVHNEYVSVCNRACMDRGTPTQEVESASHWALVALIALVCGDLLFPDLGFVEEAEYYTWVDGRPAIKRRRLVSEHIGKTCSLKIQMVNGFTKREHVLKLDPVTYEPQLFDPRFISARSDSYQNIVGPWVSAFSKKLMLCWNVSFPLTYASGLTSAALGQWYNNLLVGCFSTILENDFSRFDATISQGALLCQFLLFCSFGCPDSVLHTLLHDLDTHGVTRHGVRYHVRATRKSGNADTSVGNTVLNVLAQFVAVTNIKASHSMKKFLDYFTLASQRNVGPRHLRVMLGLILSIPSEVMGELKNEVKRGLFNLRIIGMGDDSVVAIKVVEVPVLTIKVRLMDLLLRPETVVRDDFARTTFCSGIFWPTSIGCWFTVLPGRLLAKLYYLISPVPLSITQKLAWCHGVSVAMSGLFAPIPIMRVLFKVIARNSAVYADNAKYERVVSLQHSVNIDWTNHDCGTCTPATLAMFCDRYNTTVGVIEQVEAWLDDQDDIMFALEHGLFMNMFLADVEL